MVQFKKESEYTSVEDIPEIVRLGAWIQTDDEEKLLIEANKLAIEIEGDLSAYDQSLDCCVSRTLRRDRPIDVKNAFNQVRRHLELGSRKPVNDEMVDQCRRFFITAVKSGFDTKEKLASFLHIQELTLSEISDNARKLRIEGNNVREKGRLSRRCKVG